MSDKTKKMASYNGKSECPACRVVEGNIAAAGGNVRGIWSGCMILGKPFK